jgi:hypothetical protein
MAFPLIVINGAPRTKKTSNRIVQIKGKGGGRGFTKILPSEAHEAWFKAAMTQVPIITSLFAQSGISIPIAGDLAVKALFYRDRESGDLLGYEQALADFLQEPKYRKDKVTGMPKMVRNGAGVYLDDVQIVSWDGSRLMKDAGRPRIECQIEVVQERAVPLSLCLREIEEIDIG